MGAAEDISYTGLDWSADMVADAKRNNARAMASGTVQFQQGSSDSLPFASVFFDKVLTVHTLYFWEHPGEHLSEIRRVLKPQGFLCIAFGDRAFMENLPFVPFGFTLYDGTRGQELLQESGFRVLDFQHHRERDTSNVGVIFDKVINIAQCQRI